MRVRFWGTRGSIATPGPGTVRYGGNTSCVELRSASGTVVVLDCGTGAHALGRELASEAVRDRTGHVLITHTHWDHIQGLPFFAPLRERGEHWHMYGPSGLGPSLEQALGGQMQYTYFPLTLEQFGAETRYHDLQEGEFEIGDIHVTTQYLNHPALTMGYRLQADGVTVVYATDHEPHLRDLAGGGQAPAGSEDERHAQFLADADLVIHDSQYTVEEYPEKVGWGHSTIEYAVDSAQSARARRLALFHHDPLRDDEGVDRLVARARERAGRHRGATEVFAAAEGLKWELERPRTVVAVPGGTFTGPVNADAGWLQERGVVIAMDAGEDAETVREAARAADMRVTEVGDEDALRRAVSELSPALVVLGREYAGNDALQLCRSLRESGEAHAREVPLVVVSTADAVRVEAGNEAGVSAWFTTPFSPQYARSRIRAWAMRAALRWRSAPLPPDEEARIRELVSLNVLDTPAEPRYDRYTRIASALFDMPVSLITLVDVNRQWFKSSTGTDLTETSRDMAFCSHALHESSVMQVPDAHADERFADNPLVTGPPHVRFYAGAPLRLSSGRVAGTLCVVDQRPRRLDDAQCAMLEDMAEMVVRELEQPRHREPDSREKHPIGV